MKLLSDATAKIGLCLSGGGFRASLFHLGALRRLNEAGVLSRVSVISSVSGGSILAGLLAARWKKLELIPGTTVFRNFAEQVEGPMTAYCGENLRNSLLAEHLNPIKLFQMAGKEYSFTNLLAEHYDKDLLGGATMDVLDEIVAAGGPKFVICASSLQTGVLWRFEAGRVGDYQVGYTSMPKAKLGLAVAASSAFPVMFPPLELPLPKEGWTGGDAEDDEKRKKWRETAILSDGGVYDNMGLEPVWKPNGGMDVVLCSDGGAPFETEATPAGDLVRRLKRVSDIVDRANRAQRKQHLMERFADKVYDGTYWGIGTDIAKYPLVPVASGYRGDVLEKIAQTRTDLDVFKAGEQGVLRNHGWLLSGAALASHCEHPCPAGEVPAPDLLDGAKALAAMK